jgi:hypothetical protein
MRFDCEAARDHIDAWAIGALDPDERRALDAHIATCADCARDAHLARDAAASIGMAVPMLASSAALKPRVMGAAAVLTRAGRDRATPLWQAAAAAMLVFAIGAAGWAIHAQTRMNDLESEQARISADATAASQMVASQEIELREAAASWEDLAQTIETQNQVLEIAFEPDVVWTTLEATEEAPGATGRCVWSRAQSHGAFIADNLPGPPPGQAYRMWLVYERKWVNAGTIEVDDEGRGHLIMKRVWTDDDYGPFTGYAVTLEPVEGSSPRSGDIMLTSYAP